MTTGAIPVTSSAGVHVTGLTIGHVYDLANTGGPWNPHGVTDHTDDTYSWVVSLNGSSWSGALVTPHDPINAATPTAPGWVTQLSYLDSFHVNLEFTATQTDLYIRVPDSVWSDNTGSLGYSVVDVSDYCTYGSRVKSQYTDLQVLDPGLLVTLVGAATEGWFWPLIAFFGGQVFNVGILCATSRPSPEVMTVDDILAVGQFPPTPATIAAVDKAWRWFKWFVWPTFCECVPGSPPPVEPPAKTDPGPGRGPPSPLASFTCDGEDLCQQMRALTLAVSGIAQSQRQMSTLVTLIQRQGVPFGFIPGTVHSGLSGTGHFTVSDILGLSVSYTTVPPRFIPRPGDPTVYYRLGWVNVGTVDGWQRAWETTHDPYLILPLSGALTRVGYDFADGAVATITELVREA